ncbi:protein FAR1-RELATED SEQUENCE 5-like [Ipomoea triloba]|uniref:protein FAR1-RELATED SEQUENCE 5-like n=1 Tax=Ipomoea triloba TaxID=35885 RepID=UPI00125E7452|nr:protein FAR1-RELATED SEQUENCE 5-like [Ipomoea triloba]
MVFVPFTCTDNHKRCVTFRAGLLTNEDIPSYVWLLQCLKEAMCHDPSCFVTDQDPAMKTAIAQVYSNARHRYCMWHIMTKVGEKVGLVLSKDVGFRQKLNAIVWDETLQPNVFEDRWCAVLAEYGLLDHSWFSQLWEARTSWIPAYFKDVFLSGMVTTTSRSEGQNSFFGRYLSPTASLVEFFSHFDSAIDVQRQIQLKLNADCDGHYSELKTPLLLERHASAVYTITVFHEVQKEIYAGCFFCRLVSIKACGDIITYDIKEDDVRLFTVHYSSTDNSATCSCSKF